MRRAAVDIGTNSMRLLIVDHDGSEVGRWQKVTGLGKGVEGSGRLADDAVERTITVLTEYGRRMREHGVDRARAVATSATRDADNRDELLDRAEAALGVRPEMIPGLEEARLSFQGATSDAPGDGPYLVCDIGGGSTELVWGTDGDIEAVSVDIGSVRLTDRALPDRPATFDQLAEAAELTGRLLQPVVPAWQPGTVIGVAGTWTSLAAIHLALPAYDRVAVHHARIDRIGVERLTERLAGLTVDETAGIPALDPARAPVILAGAVVAREVMRQLTVGEVVVSERDLLDGVVAGLIE